MCIIICRPTPPGYPLNSGPFGGPYASPLGGFNSGLLNMVPPGVSHPTLVAQTGGQEPLSPITDNRHWLVIINEDFTTLDIDLVMVAC